MRAARRSAASLLLAVSLLAGCGDNNTEARLAEQERRIAELEEALAAATSTTVPAAPPQPTPVPTPEEGRAFVAMMSMFGSHELAAALLYTMPPRDTENPLDVAMQTFIDRGSDPDFLSEMGRQWWVLVDLLLTHCPANIDRLLAGFVGAEITPSTAADGRGWSVSFYVVDEAGDRCSLEVDSDAEPSIGTIHLRQR